MDIEYINKLIEWTTPFGTIAIIFILNSRLFLWFLTQKGKNINIDNNSLLEIRKSFEGNKEIEPIVIQIIKDKLKQFQFFNNNLDKFVMITGTILINIYAFLIIVAQFSDNELPFNDQSSTDYPQNINFLIQSREAGNPEINHEESIIIYLNADIDENVESVTKFLRNSKEVFKQSKECYKHLITLNKDSPCEVFVSHNLKQNIENYYNYVSDLATQLERDGLLHITNKGLENIKKELYKYKNIETAYKDKPYAKLKFSLASNKDFYLKRTNNINQNSDLIWIKASWFKKGYYRKYDEDNFRIALTHFTWSDKITIKLSRLSDNKTIKILTNIKVGDETSFNLNNENYYTFRFDRTGSAGRNPFTRAAFFTLKKWKIIE